MTSKENISSENVMLTASTGKLLLTRSLPLMLSMFVASLYNVVDSLFVSHISENALTAISLAFPIQLLMISITVGISIGINASLSRFLGEKNQKGVNEVASNGIYSLIVTLVRVVILFPTLYILFKVFEINIVWWAFVLANAGSALTGAFLLKHIYSQKVATIVSEHNLKI